MSGQYSVNSYPVFSPKTRKGYYSYLDDEGETRKVMIQLDQLAPFYLGHFGNTASDTSLHHYDGLICEKIEEIAGGKGYDSNGYYVDLDINGVMEWSDTNSVFYNKIYDAGRYLNLVDGLSITTYLVEYAPVGATALAAKYCYMKNDINGDGVIDSATEPINWYLPAQNQLMAMWINKIAFDSDPDYALNIGDSYPYYWSCSEVDSSTWGTPTNFDTYAISMNILEGETSLGISKNSKIHIRCVRGVE